MPFKRPRYVKRRSSSFIASKKRRTTKRMRSKRSGLSSNVHRYTRWATSVTRDTGVTGSNYAETFMLSNVMNAGELTALYDHYRINSVTVKLHLVSNPDLIYPPGGNPTTTTTNPTWYPKLWYLRDYDDNVAITVDAMKESGKSKCVIMRPNTQVSIKLRPCCLQQMYETAISTAYSSIWPKKIDCASSSVPHYGLKWNIDNESVTGLLGYKIRYEVLYDLTMLNTR